MILLPDRGMARRLKQVREIIMSQGQIYPVKPFLFLFNRDLIPLTEFDCKEILKKY